MKRNDSKALREKIEELKNIDFGILNDSIKNDIETKLKDISFAIEDFEIIESNKILLEKKIIEPISENIERGRRLQKIAILITIISLFCALLTIYNTFFYQSEILNKFISTIKQNESKNYVAGDKIIFKDRNNSFGLMNSDSTILLKADFDKIDKIYLYTIKSNAYKLYSGTKVGLCDFQGNTLIPVEYRSIDFYKNLIIVKDDLKRTGIINILNDTIAPVKYDEIHLTNNTEYVFYLDDSKFGVYSLRYRKEMTKPIIKSKRILSTNPEVYWAIVDTKYNFYKFPFNLIEKTNYTIVGGKDEFLSNSTMNFIVVFDGIGYGVINQNNELIIPCIYDKITFYDTRLIGSKNSRLIEWSIEIGSNDLIETATNRVDGPTSDN